MPSFPSVSSLQFFLTSQWSNSYIGYSKAKATFSPLTKDEATGPDSRRARRFAKKIESILINHPYGISKAACSNILENQFTSLTPSEYLGIRFIKGKERWTRIGKRKIRAITAGDALLLLNTLERRKKQHIQKKKPRSTEALTKAPLKLSIPQATVTPKRCYGQIVEDDEKPSTSSASYTPRDIAMHDSFWTSDSDNSQQQRTKSLKKRVIKQPSISLLPSDSRIEILHKLFSSDSDEDIEPTQSKGKKALKRRGIYQSSPDVSSTPMVKSLFGDISDLSSEDELDTTNREQEAEIPAAEIHLNAQAINPRRRIRARNRFANTSIATQRNYLTLNKRRIIESTLKGLQIFTYTNICNILQQQYPQLNFEYFPISKEIKRFLKTQNGQPLWQCHKNYNAKKMQAEADERFRLSRIKTKNASNKRRHNKRITNAGRVILENAIMQMDMLNITRLVEKCASLGFPTTKRIIAYELKSYAKHLNLSWKDFTRNFKKYKAVFAQDFADKRRKEKIERFRFSLSNKA